MPDESCIPEEDRQADNATLHGSCACGAVRYRLEDAPLFVHCCHCLHCQRETGSAFALNALIESSRLSVVGGEISRTTIPTRSGKGQTLYTCNACSTTLWSHYGGMGDLVYFVRVGTLDRPHTVTPDIHIFAATRQPWVRLPDGVPVSDRFYRFSEHWPAASLARRAALKPHR